MRFVSQLLGTRLRRVRRVVLTLAVVSSLGATVAVAPAAEAPTVFGGHIGPARDPFALELNPDRDAFTIGRVMFDVSVRCPRRPWLSFGEAQRLLSRYVRGGPEDLYADPVSASGDFYANGITVYRFGEHDGEVDEQITGKIVGDTATGTFLVKVRLTTQRAGRHVMTCRTSRLRWRARSLPGRIFAGLTSADRPVVLKLTRDGHKVRQMQVVSEAACRPGGSESTSTNYWRGVAVRPDGRFATSDPYSFREGGARIRGRDWVRGRITGSLARGRFRDKFTETARSGAVIRCDSGRLRWSARSSPLQSS